MGAIFTLIALFLILCYRGSLGLYLPSLAAVGCMRTLFFLITQTNRYLAGEGRESPHPWTSEKANSKSRVQAVTV